MLMDLNPMFNLSVFLKINEEPNSSLDNSPPPTLADVTDQFFTSLLNDQELPEGVANFLIRSKKSYKSISRNGFRDKEIDNDRVLDGHEQGIAILKRIRNLFHKYTNKVNVIFPSDEAFKSGFTEDREIFIRQFIKLYEDYAK